MIGQAFSFDGQDDYVEVPPSDDLYIPGDVTLHFWAKRTVFGVSGFFNVMVYQGAGVIDGVNVPGSYGLGFGSNMPTLGYSSNVNYITGNFERDDTGIVTGAELVGPEVTDKAFHHYAYVRAGTNHKLYLDGNMVASDTIPASPGDAAGLPLVIGAAADRGDSSCCQFGGVVDEVQVFNRALSDLEIKDIYYAGKPEGNYEVTVTASAKGIEYTGAATVVVLELPFATGPSMPAVASQSSDAARVLGSRTNDDLATISQGASIHDVSSGLAGIDPCAGETVRLPCSDPRDVIERVNQFSIYGFGAEIGNFLFGSTDPQYLIIDLGRVVELDSIGADFSERGRDRGVDAFGVFVSLDGEEYTPLAAPVDNPNPPVVFSVDTPVQARFIAYYFGRCSGPGCPGSRVLEVYAIEVAS